MKIPRTSIQENIQIVLFIGIFVALPFSMLLTNIFMYGLLLNSILTYEKGKLKNGLKNPIFFVFLTFFLLHLISILYSENFNKAVFSLEKKVVFLALPFLLLFQVKIKKEKLNYIFYFFSISILIGALICLLYAVYRNFTLGDPSFKIKYSYYHNFNVGNSLIYWDYFSYSELLSPIKIHPTYFALYTTIVLYFITLKIYEKKINIYFGIFIGLFLTLFLFLISSRIAIIILIFIYIPFIFIYILNQISLLKRTLIFVSVIFFIVSLLFLLPITKYRLIGELKSLKNSSFFLGTTEKDKAAYTGLNMRVIHLKAAIKLIKENFWLGTGIGDSQESLNKIYKNLGYSELNNYPVHNQFLQTWVEVGILGFILCLLIFVYPIVISWKNQEIFFTLIFLTFLFTALTENILTVFKGIIFFSTISYLFYSIKRS